MSIAPHRTLAEAVEFEALLCERMARAGPADHDASISTLASAIAKALNPEKGTRGRGHTT